MALAPLSLVLVVLCVSLVDVGADGAKDNAASSVRPVPPPGIAVPEADRAALLDDLSRLGERIRVLKEATTPSERTAEALSDVAIYHRAVDQALRYDEFFDSADANKARALLQTGIERATALAEGHTPWLEKAGPTALGYVSRIDGSVQPYGAWIPPTWTPTLPRRWRLDTWFHGRGEKLSEVSFLDGVAKSGGPFTRPDAFVLQPYGRYCNGSKFAGEVDFFEALGDLKRRFRIDEDRILVRGFSLGGATTWHLAAHFASDWAAAAPGAGFSETAEFLRVFQEETLEPSWWERKLWQLYDAPAYAENFRNLPLVAYSGEIDRQKQAADRMAKALAPVGIDLLHVIGPQTAHSYHPESIVILNRLLDALAEKGRDPLPRRVSLTTPTLKYNRQAWVTVDALGEHWRKALVEAEIVNAAGVRVTTTNVTALTLAMPPGRAPFPAAAGSPSVLIDGQRLAQVPGVRSDRSWTASAHKDGWRWITGPLPETGLRKRHDLQGPVDDAFMGSFLFVTPTGPPLGERVGHWVAAEQERAQKEWRRQFRGDARVKRDRDVGPDDVASHNLVLWGDPQSNLVLASLIEKLPIRWTKEAIVVGADRYPTSDHGLILVHPNPSNPARYVVLNSGFTFREYDALNNARQVPKLPDWAVVDLGEPPDTRRPGRIAAAGFFGEKWELLAGLRADPARQSRRSPAP